MGQVPNLTIWDEVHEILGTGGKITFLYTIVVEERIVFLLNKLWLRRFFLYAL